jgi:membrane glycosyltransferase
VKRNDWMNDVRNRQRNIAPEDVIRNDAIVEGSLIRGDEPLSTVQRIGAIIIGMFLLAVGIIGLWAASSVMVFGGMENRFEHAVLVPLGGVISFGFAYIGYRMIRSGLTGGRPQRRKRSR